LTVASLALIALFLHLRGFYLKELYEFTGGAQWIWPSDDLRTPDPTVCVLYRRLSLHERPLEAVAKICGDRSYVLWINGQIAMAGYNRPAYHLDVVPVTDLLNPGSNLLVIEARSPTSVGGVLFSLDLVPSVEGHREGDPRGRSVLVSDGQWRVVERMWPGFPGLPPAGGTVPWIWGRPPDHPWAYPMPIRHDLPWAQALSGTEIRVEADAFKRDRNGVWRHELGGWFRGLLRLEGELPAPCGMELRVVAKGDDRSGFRPVIPLPGQERWLLAGIVEGSVVEIKGPKPPERVVLLPFHPTAGPRHDPPSDREHDPPRPGSS